jgi:glycosyltransferase involved in cell wall biosynthesis
MSAAGVEHPPSGADDTLPVRELVVCSLDPWDEVWRRNQFFVDALLRSSPALRVLFVEPPADVLFEIAKGRRPTMPGIRSVRGDRRLRALRPLKPLPRRLGSLADRALHRQVIVAARRLGFTRPTLWLNDVTYAPLIRRTGWPTVYDVTDDWLLAPFPQREIERLSALDAMALADADEVVVCSPALAASRGAARGVTLVANGVDSEHFRRPQARPQDLPPAPTAVYVGTLHDSRLDVELVIELARSLPELSVVLVGPDALPAVTRRRVVAEPNIHLLGPRPYADVPAYLQHADVVIMPHLVTPFTESLDPIKAYECLAVSTPTVATAVAGFRELSRYIRVVPRESFVEAVDVARAAPRRADLVESIGSWTERASAFERLLTSAAQHRSRAGEHAT